MKIRSGFVSNSSSSSFLLSIKTIDDLSFLIKEDMYITSLYDEYDEDDVYFRYNLTKSVEESNVNIINNMQWRLDKFTTNLVELDNETIIKKLFELDPNIKRIHDTINNEFKKEKIIAYITLDNYTYAKEINKIINNKYDNVKLIKRE